MEINYQLLPESPSGFQIYSVRSMKKFKFFGKNGLFLWEICEFSGKFRRKRIGKKEPISWQSSDYISWESIMILHWFHKHFLLKKMAIFPLFENVHVVAPVTETSTSCKCCLCKTSDTAGRLEHLIWTIVHVCICLTARFFLTAIIICFWPQLVPSFSQLLH